MLQLIRNHPSKLARIWLAIESKSLYFFSLIFWPNTFFTVTGRSISKSSSLFTHIQQLLSTSFLKRIYSSSSNTQLGSGSREYNATLYSWPKLPLK